MIYKEVEFLEFIIWKIIYNTDSLKITRIEDELWVLLTINVSKEDMWILIWKSWKTINSLRNITRLFWVKINKKINIKVLD